MADAAKWHVVLRNDELDIEAQYAREDASGTLRFFNELANGSQETVAAFAKGDRSRYYRPEKVTQSDPGGFNIA